MTWRRLLQKLIVFVIAVAAAAPSVAHPAPFSYLDVRLSGTALQGTLVLHDFDVAHELKLAAPEPLLDPATLATYASAIKQLVIERVRMKADGQTVKWEITNVRPVPERTAIEIAYRVPFHAAIGRLTIDATLFPYDANHQTFVNVYEGDILTRQQVLSAARPSMDFYAGGRQGAFAVFKEFTAAGIHHIAIGPDHILFIVGLLLLGGSVLRLLAIVSAFTVGHSLTLSLAALNIVAPPARIVEPAIALSIVYVGADNLLSAKGARDIRAWIALFFGLVHGFGFASVLREIGLPPRALGISLFAFNLGVEIGQAVLVVIVASLLSLLRSRSPTRARQVVTAASVVVTLAGTYWFVERIW
ncbi:MAG TPA: HupE/UreJ family protein [Vicinamibacterales bacterium]|nr:HupE/UreJ family protein [Vicinamibacterales bacterium]